MWFRFSRLFWISSILFSLHQIVEKWWSIPWVHAYLDDILAPCIVLGLALAFFQNVFPADPDFRIPKYWILIFIIWYALLFEWYFPSIDSRHFSDPYDILAYTVGGILFAWLGNRPLGNSSETKATA